MPQYYAFCARFSANESIIIDHNDDILPDVWDNNVIVQLNLSTAVSRYEAGIDVDHLQEHVIKDDASSVKTITDELNAMQIKNNDENTSDRLAAAAAARREVKKKGKNKKRLSYSESHCDILKSELDDGGDEATHDGQSDDATTTTNKSNSIAIVKSPNKLRRFSESSNDEHSATAASASATAATKGIGMIKGILKRRSISESSTDEHVYSCSIDLGVGSIPEEEPVAAEVSESCKKTVRFDNNIRKQLFK